LSSVHRAANRRILAQRAVKANARRVSSLPNAKAISPALASFALTALAIGIVWWWLGAGMALPPSPLPAGAKLYCVSYAPFRAGQDPLVEGTRVEPWQIEEDLALLSKYSNCVRTYSIDDGAESVLASARRHGLKVLHGVWLSNQADKNRRQIATTAALAKEYADVISAVIVGNEVLLRGEMSATDLTAAIREVKAQVAKPVTYADVWEYWLRYADVRNAVDFVTIHILPYWEDFPIPASLAAAHVAAIHARVAAAIPGKDILIGEFGWPSAGRMRERARPSPWNQARVISETLTLAEREHFKVNIIEAFDQPWKRALEGAVGGYWGIFDRATGGLKFRFAGTVSEHPHWPWQAAAGIALAALSFAGAFAAGRGKGFSPYLWPSVAALSFLPAVMFGWTIETVPVESFSVGSWLRSLAFAATAGAAPVVCAMACAAGRAVPAFSSLLCRGGKRPDGLDWALGGTLIALMLVSIEAALGLVFDPRYRDIAFAPLTAAALPFLVVLVSAPRPAGARATAETVGAAVLALSGGYVLFNEGFANWQSVSFCAGLFGLAFILALARAAPSPG
jgi:glucan 1,3-beta-glucosidase